MTNFSHAISLSEIIVTPKHGSAELQPRPPKAEAPRMRGNERSEWNSPVDAFAGVIARASSRSLPCAQERAGNTKESTNQNVDAGSPPHSTAKETRRGRRVYIFQALEEKPTTRARREHKRKQHPVSEFFVLFRGKKSSLIFVNPLTSAQTIGNAFCLTPIFV